LLGRFLSPWFWGWVVSAVGSTVVFGMIDTNKFFLIVVFIVLAHAFLISLPPAIAGAVWGHYARSKARRATP
jgi:hypothetical protein